MGSARQVCQTSGFSHTAATGLPAAAGQPRRAQRAAGLSAFVGHHRHSENIGQQLGPERTAGAAAHQRALRDRRPALFQCLQAVVDPKAHPPAPRSRAARAGWRGSCPRRCRARQDRYAGFVPRRDRAGRTARWLYPPRLARQSPPAAPPPWCRSDGRTTANSWRRSA